MIIQDSRFKATTIWPELVNKRIKTVDIQLIESRIIKRDAQLLLRGVILRRVIYFDYVGRNRKTEDRLQFEIMTDDPKSNLEPDYLDIELQTDFFIFQPRRIGESQAIFEHGIRLIIRCKNNAGVEPDPGSLLPLLADVILKRDQGTMILSYPAFFTEPGIEPKSFHGQIHFSDNPKELPVVTGLIKGIITYINCKKLLGELTYEFPLSLLLNVPPLTEVQCFQIQGRITDAIWRLDVTTQEWRITLKMEYQWRIFEKKQVICIIRPKSDNINYFKIQAPLRLTELKNQLCKNFLIPIKNLVPVELKFIKHNHNVSITKKGILVTSDYHIEIYTIDAQGQESYQYYPVTWDELIATEWGDKSIGEVLPIIAEINVNLINFLKEYGNLKISTVIEYQIRLYRNRIFEINEAEYPNTLILGKILSDRKEFYLTRSNILMLRLQPVLFKEFKIRQIKILSQNHEGWININGQIELSVTYIDRNQNLREDVFSISVWENFLWDKLQTTDEVKIEYRLEHDSFGVYRDNPLKLNYHFILSLVVESFQKRELNIDTVISDSPNIEPDTTTNQVFNQEMRARKQSFYELSDNFRLTFHNYKIAGEVTVMMRKVWEIENGRFAVHNLDYRSEANLIIVECEIAGTIDYWDSDGYLRCEPVEFTFWKCFLNDWSFNLKNGRIFAELHQLRYLPERVFSWRKGKVKISFCLELKQIIPKEGN